MKSINTIFISCLALNLLTANAQNMQANINDWLATNTGKYFQWYQQLHTSPELSSQELNTSAFLKKQISGYGYTVIDSIGLHSFIGMLKNGDGPVVLYRTEMDGLPVKELTGLPYASVQTTQNNGKSVSVMHACGHDFHMSTWLSVAAFLSQNRKSWKGTVLFLAQSSEETAQGAKRILSSKNYQQLPTPDYCFAIHDNADLEAGKAGFCNQYAMAGVDMMNITIYGKGGHGAAPHKTIDPILLAAQFITEIQTIVSRNLSSNDPAVITVGAIHGGEIGNVIPNQVELKLTIRSFDQKARTIILNRIKTIGDNLARAAGLSDDKLPNYDLLDMTIPAVYNDPALGAKLKKTITTQIGPAAIKDLPPVMIGEDFGLYAGTGHLIPSYILWMGTQTEQRIKAFAQKNEELPTLHSSYFYPEYETALPASIRMVTVCLLEMLNSKK